MSSRSHSHVTHEIQQNTRESLFDTQPFDFTDLTTKGHAVIQNIDFVNKHATWLFYCMDNKVSIIYTFAIFIKLNYRCRFDPKLFSNMWTIIVGVLNYNFLALSMSSRGLYAQIRLLRVNNDDDNTSHVRVPPTLVMYRDAQAHL